MYRVYLCVASLGSISFSRAQIYKTIGHIESEMSVISNYILAFRTDVQTQYSVVLNFSTELQSCVQIFNITTLTCDIIIHLQGIKEIGN